MCAGPVWTSHLSPRTVYLAPVMLASALSVRARNPAGTPEPPMARSASICIPVIDLVVSAVVCASGRLAHAVTSTAHSVSVSVLDLTAHLAPKEGIGTETYSGGRVAARRIIERSGVACAARLGSPHVHIHPVAHQPRHVAPPEIHRDHVPGTLAPDEPLVGCPDRGEYARRAPGCDPIVLARLDHERGRPDGGQQPARMVGQADELREERRRRRLVVERGSPRLRVVDGPRVARSE